MDPRVQQNKRAFFSEQNESMLYGMLSKNFQQRLGSQLNEKQTSHLERALEFYMGEIFQAKGSSPVQELNKETLSVTANEFNEYLQRQKAVALATPQMFQETSQRYDQLQQDRQRNLEAPRPPVPEYVQSITIKEDNSISALSLFEEAKNRRNMEMSVQAEEQLAKRITSANQPLYLEAPQNRPDPRSMYDRPLDLVIAGQQQELPGRGDVNPTVGRPGPASNLRGSLQQDILIKQEDIQSFKETEYNLSIYSADRKWEFDTLNGENRFNFSVNLYSGNPTNGVSLMPKGTARLRNIVRIEFVKAVLPIEVTEMLVRKTNSTTYDTTYLKNIFAYPFVTLNVDELDTNSYGTNNTMDNAFGILQYDSNWTDNTNSLGFTSLIPKHMKCQRVYSPTPLATLTKLSVRLQQPNGSIINTTRDTLDINGVFLSSSGSIHSYFGDTTNTISLTNTAYNDVTAEYIWIDSKEWFGKYDFAVGDRIQIRNLSLTTPSSAQTDLTNFITNTNGITIVGTAYSQTNSSGVVTGLIDGCNNYGYSRFLILRGKFSDPTTGSTSIQPYDAVSNNSVISATKIPFNTGGKLINLSRQTQLIFRVITREYDSSSLVRPDNL
jgi:hypothetical protein